MAEAGVLTVYRGEGYCYHSLLRPSDVELPEEAAGELTVDANRAYLSAPTDGQVYEIDFADNARIARTFPIDGGMTI